MLPQGLSSAGSLKTVFAFRFVLNGINGVNLPVQMLQSIGGNQTLRGYPQDRYLDKSSALVNAEIRIPAITAAVEVGFI